jgi:tetratricopeptide (TPR) repeat protein/tRNA A-37 threonylcarbamoyl transferase component Bud32
MENEERLKAALADRYQIEREIGSGGMATVYLAQDLRHDRQVAVKVLNPEVTQSLGAERFLRESKTVANLTHSHILPLFDSGEADGFLFYVMPYVKGESLWTRLTKEKQLPAEDAIQITREIADALAYPHEEGVIHRDVKPANIMLGAGHAVLADFGVAHAVAEAREDRITRTGTSLGTPAYMSHEQAMGERELDGRSDQYALGCVLYEMLAGHPPFTGAQVEAVVRQHLTAEPPSVTQVRPAVTEEVVRVINRALAKSPADRFKNTAEMAAALAVTTTPAQKAEMGMSRWYRVGIAMVVLAALIVLGIRVLGPGGASDLDRRVVAVMPFENLTGNLELEYVGRMASVGLTQLLQSTGRVMVRNYDNAWTAFEYAKTLVEQGEASSRLEVFASELGAGTIIHGAYDLQGGQLCFDASVTNAVSGNLLWLLPRACGNTDSPRTAIEALRPRLMGAMATEFDSALEPYVNLVVHSPTAEAAREFAIGARLYLEDSEHEEAVTHLLRAHELDPEFYAALNMARTASSNIPTAAGTALADSIRSVLSDHQLELPPYDRALLQASLALQAGDLQGNLRWFEQACDIAPGEKACYNFARALSGRGNDPRRAIEVLTTQLQPEKGWMRGWVAYWQVLSSAHIVIGESQRALDVLEEAREVHPRENLDLQLVAALAGSGRVDEAMAFLEDSIPVLFPDRRPAETSSVGWRAYLMGAVLHHEGSPEEANRAWDYSVGWLLDRIKEDPDNRTLHYRIGLSLYLLGRLEEAEEHWERAVELNPASLGSTVGLSMIAVKRGDRDEGGRRLAWVDEQGLSHFMGGLYKARLAEAMGDRVRAVDYLREMRSGPVWDGSLYDRLIGSFPSLHGYPPFEDLVWPRNR